MFGIIRLMRYLSYCDLAVVRRWYLSAPDAQHINMGASLAVPFSSKSRR